VLLSLTLFLAACEQDSPTRIEDAQDSAGILVDGADAAVTDALELGSRTGVQTWAITVENLTPDTGEGGAQVFSPPILATHRGNGVIYRMNQFASPELAGVAEDALNGPLVDALSANSRVYQVVGGDAAIAPGASATYMVESEQMGLRLSAAFMLVNTNDAFAGVNSVRLPRSGSAVYQLYALDAGSEENTELVGDIPGPCCDGAGNGTPTRERIHLHEGIQGIGDLDVEKWGWTGPVATLTIEAID
jgi:hypothetical protein